MAGYLMDNAPAAAPARATSVPTDNGASSISSQSALSPNQVRAIAYQAGFRGQALNIAVQLTTPESGRVPTARYNPGPQEDSRGLWQINLAAHPQYANANLADPLTNARAAYAVSNGGRDFSPWTTFVSGAYRNAPTGNGLPAMPTGGMVPPAGSSAAPQAGQPSAQDRAALIAGQFLSNEAKNNPWDVPVKGAIQGSNPLLSLGILPTSASQLPAGKTTPLHLAVAQGKLQALAGGTPLNAHPALKGSGYTNPIPGAALSRTDMGVDANLPVGHPIVALGDSRVIGISPNWYKGQPYVLMQLLNGPQAGKYWYVAEQIAPTVRPGQLVKAGQPIGTYAAQGTGIEIGWGSPTPGQTLAQQQGNTGDRTHANAPAGINFRSFLGGL